MTSFGAPAAFPAFPQQSFSLAPSFHGGGWPAIPNAQAAQGPGATPPSFEDPEKQNTTSGAGTKDETSESGFAFDRESFFGRLKRYERIGHVLAFLAALASTGLLIFGMQQDIVTVTFKEGIFKRDLSQRALPPPPPKTWPALYHIDYPLATNHSNTLQLRDHTWTAHLHPVTYFGCDTLGDNLPSLVKKALCVVINVVINMFPPILFFNSIHLAALICISVFTARLFLNLVSDICCGSGGCCLCLFRCIMRMVKGPCLWFFLLFRFILVFLTLFFMWFAALIDGLVYTVLGHHDFDLHVVELIIKPGYAFYAIYCALVLVTCSTVMEFLLFLGSCCLCLAENGCACGAAVYKVGSGAGHLAQSAYHATQGQVPQQSWRGVTLPKVPQAVIQKSASINPTSKQSQNHSNSHSKKHKR